MWRMNRLFRLPTKKYGLWSNWNKWLTPGQRNATIFRLKLLPSQKVDKVRVTQIDVATEENRLVFEESFLMWNMSDQN